MNCDATGSKLHSSKTVELAISLQQNCVYVCVQVGVSSAATPSAQRAPQQDGASSPTGVSTVATTQGQQCTAEGVVKALMDLKQLTDAGLLTSSEFEHLEARVRAGD